MVIRDSSLGYHDNMCDRYVLLLYKEKSFRKAGNTFLFGNCRSMEDEPIWDRDRLESGSSSLLLRVRFSRLPPKILRLPDTE